jgi:hypothetical protein
VVLVDAAHRAELIVFGTHRMSSLRNPALGTVSLDCIRLGDCPVLIIPDGVAEPSRCGDLVPALRAGGPGQGAVASPPVREPAAGRGMP